MWAGGGDRRDAAEAAATQRATRSEHRGAKSKLSVRTKCKKVSFTVLAEPDRPTCRPPAVVAGLRGEPEVSGRRETYSGRPTGTSEEKTARDKSSLCASRAQDLRSVRKPRLLYNTRSACSPITHSFPPASSPDKRPCTVSHYEANLG